MSSLVFGALCAFGGLIAGWVLIPQPRWIANVLAKLGLRDRVP